MENVKILKISGMTCQSCAERIEGELIKLEGITNVKVDFKKSCAQIECSDSFDVKQAKEAIKELGYEVSTEGEKSNEFSNGQLIGIGIIIFAIYLIIEKIIGFNFIPKVESTMNLGILFAIGVLTSLHCIAMCGGISISQSIVRKEQTADVKTSALQPSIYYNLGRVISYTLIGGIVGGIGALFNFSNTAKIIITVVAGILMILIGFNMLNIFGFIRKFRFFPKFKINTKGKSPLYVGLLNGLMPCGPLQSMQIYALGTGSIYMGALSMLIFSLGTVPLLLGLGTLVSYLGNRSMKKVLKISAVLILFLGLVMINRGFVLSGQSILPISSTSSIEYATVKDEYQYITTEVTANKYSPDVLVIQKDVPVTWIIKAKELNGCNNPITIPAMGISKTLKLGENTLSFTHNVEDKIIYTCHMGMIKANILVVKDLKDVKKEDVNNLIKNSGSSSCYSSDGSCTSCSESSPTK